MPLGLQKDVASPGPRGPDGTSTTNTRVSLWPERWPAIALQACIDEVEAAPPDRRGQVKAELPCKTCTENSRCLNSKRKELGPLMYDREILTKPRSSESSLFPMELFEPLLARDQVLVPHWLKPFGDEERYAVAQAWDLAWSERIGGDFLVCETAYLDRATGRRHMLDIERWQQVSFDEQIQLIATKWNLYKADLVVIEDDAAQAIWSKHVGRNTAVPVLPHGASGKTDMASGVPGLILMLETRRWEFPYGDQASYHRDEMDVFLAECEAFGWSDGKLQGVGEHDDTVMCWWHLNWALDRLQAAESGRTEIRRNVVPGARI